ncbi:MAG: hypothetical protein P4L80_10110 [Xanthobacteraceae bacterium]|nr:hypothetical protein [Xanthobacteraceae bacterium]
MTAIAEEGSQLHRQVFWPALAFTIGAAGVAATSFFYLLSPPEAVLPFVPLDPAQAAAGALRGAAMLHIAGLIGIMSDVILASAALSLGAQASADGGADSRALGWSLLATATLVFIGVDAALGFVLPALAAQTSAAFLGGKIFADTLFSLGTFGFGLGGILLLMPYIRGRARGLGGAAWPALVFATISILAGVGTLLGFDLHNFIGLGIGGGAVAFVVVGLRLLLPAQP